MRYMRALTVQDVAELYDLYKWGARMCDLEMLYGCTRATIKRALRRTGVAIRSTGRVLLAAPKLHSNRDQFRSSRPRLPEGALIVDDRPTPDQLLCSSAHAQRDRRIAEHQLDAKSYSCLEEVSSSHCVSSHSDNPQQDHE